MFIRWTTLAARDLTGIADYIVERNGPAAARRVAIAIYDRVDSLPAFPHRGRPGRVSDTRELVIPGLAYLAVYRVKGEIIEVVRVLHGAQQWP